MIYPSGNALILVSGHKKNGHKKMDIRKKSRYKNWVLENWILEKSSIGYRNVSYSITWQQKYVNETHKFRIRWGISQVDKVCILYMYYV